MKSVILIAIAFVLLIPISVYADVQVRGTIISGSSNESNVKIYISNSDGLKGDSSSLSFVTKSTTVTKPVSLITYDVDVTVLCDPGSFVTGGGHDISVPRGNSGATILYDGPSGNGYKVNISNTPDSPATVFAICVTP